MVPGIGRSTRRSDLSTQRPTCLPPKKAAWYHCMGLPLPSFNSPTKVRSGSLNSSPSSFLSGGAAGTNAPVESSRVSTTHLSPYSLPHVNVFPLVLTSTPLPTVGQAVLWPCSCCTSQAALSLRTFERAALSGGKGQRGRLRARFVPKTCPPALYTPQPFGPRRSITVLLFDPVSTSYAASLLPTFERALSGGEGEEGGVGPVVEGAADEALVGPLSHRRMPLAPAQHHAARTSTICIWRQSHILQSPQKAADDAELPLYSVKV